MIISVLQISSCDIEGKLFRDKDDGTSSLSDNDKTRINKYEGQNPKDLTGGIYTVNSNDIKMMSSFHDYNWTMIMASWCPHCAVDFPLKVKLTDSLSQTKDLLFIPVFVNYNMKETDRIIKEAGYKGPVFILSNSYLGTNETAKHLKFVKEVFNHDQPSNMVPHHLISNKNNELLFEKLGELRNTDTLKTVFH